MAFRDVLAIAVAALGMQTQPQPSPQPRVDHLAVGAVELQRSIYADAQSAAAAGRPGVSRCLVQISAAVGTVGDPLEALRELLMLKGMMRDSRDSKAVAMVAGVKAKEVVSLADAALKQAAVGAGECSADSLVQGRYRQVSELISSSVSAAGAYTALAPPADAPHAPIPPPKPPSPQP
jgi:hypothetical protein